MITTGRNDGDHLDTAPLIALASQVAGIVRLAVAIDAGQYCLLSVAILDSPRGQVTVTGDDLAAITRFLGKP